MGNCLHILHILHPPLDCTHVHCPRQSAAAARDLPSTTMQTLLMVVPFPRLVASRGNRNGNTIKHLAQEHIKEREHAHPSIALVSDSMFRGPMRGSRVHSMTESARCGALRHALGAMLPYAPYANPSTSLSISSSPSRRCSATGRACVGDMESVIRLDPRCIA